MRIICQSGSRPGPAWAPPPGPTPPAASLGGDFDAPTPADDHFGNAPALHLRRREFKRPKGERLRLFWEPSGQTQHETTDGVPFVVRQGHPYRLGQIGDRQPTLDPPSVGR